MARVGRQTAERRAAAHRPDGPPFAQFLERDALREARRLRRRRTIAISVALHVVVFGSMFLYSVFRLVEFGGPSVEVKVFSPAAAPPEARPGVRVPRPAPSTAASEAR